EAARRSLQQALLLALVLGVLGFFVLGQAAHMLRWMGQPSELVLLADRYLQVMRWGVLPALLGTALRGFLDSLGLPRFGLLVALSAIGINLLGNWLLVFGKWGLPALGIAGSGLATVCVNLWVGVCLAGFILAEPKLRAYRVFSRWRLHGATLREQLRIGVPAAFAMMAEVWLFTGLSFLMGRLGTAAVAAHQIALNAASVAFMIALGISNASTVRVGQAIGRGEPLAARRAGLVGMGLGMACMSLTGLLFWLAPQLVIGAYIDLHVPANAAVVALAMSLLRLAALFQIFDALQATSQGALRGIKDTFGPMLLGFASYWGVGLGSGLWLGFGLGWGAQGLWIGLILGLMAAGLALATRFVLKTRPRV
ncbi:MAG: MATE family efflux transporter, partial [Candidatus Sericytochromatia bacterium]